MVYEGIINSKPITKIHRSIYDFQQKQKKQGVVIDNVLFAFAIRLASKTINRMPKYAKESKESRAEYFLDSLKKENVFDKTNKIINKEVEDLSALAKDIVIQETIKTARKEDKVFYLCSKHDDCASDHLDYQGKIYVDENFDKRNADIVNYVIMNNIHTVQWVMYRPVWMVTRPHCRHYFKALKTEDVLTKSVDKLIRDNRMHHKTGKYEMQTIRYKTGEETLKAYEERLRYHEYLYAVHKTETLRKLIKKDKLLIAKWKDYLKK